MQVGSAKVLEAASQKAYQIRSGAPVAERAHPPEPLARPLLVCAAIGQANALARVSLGSGVSSCAAQEETKTRFRMAGLSH